MCFWIIEEVEEVEERISEEMQQDQQRPAVDDPIRTAILNKKLTLWERFLRWVYSREEWQAYLLEKIEKARAKGVVIEFFKI